ncbi:MAG: hypothetical protein ACOX1Q_04755 [Eubacteriales bacterium]|jgi:ABC-type glycerol-3-phosphate transport system substrate-binding protein
MISRVQKLVVITLLIAIFVFVLCTMCASASATSDSITIFVPNSSKWLTETVEAFSHNTGIRVIIETANMRYEDYSAALPKLMRNSGYDLLLSMVQPIETNYNHKNLVNLREVIENDPSFDIDAYFTNVLDSYSAIDGDSIYTIPISFNFSLLVASETAAETLGYTLPDSIPSRQAFTVLCEEMEISDEVYILSDADLSPDDKSGGVSKTGWVATDFMMEALSLITVDESPRFEDKDRWKSLFLDYFDYYTYSFKSAQAQNMQNLIKPLDLLTSGKLLFCPVEFDEVFNPRLKDGYRLYEFPYSDAELRGTYHSVKGLSIVKNGNEKAAWEFIKYILSYDVQSQLLDSCPILREAARERIESIQVGNVDLFELSENCSSPSYISPSGGGYLQSNTIYTYMQEASYIIRYALTGIMDKYNFDSTEISYSAQAKIIENFRSASPHIRSKVSFFLYLIPLLLVIAAAIILGIVARHSKEHKRLKSFFSGKPLVKISGHKASKAKFKWLAILCYVLALGLITCCFAFDEKSALFYPITSFALAIHMIALSIFLLFYGKHFEIQIFDGHYLVLQGIKAYFFTQNDIERVEWSLSVNVSGCKLIINGPRVIHLRYLHFQDLDRLKAYVSTKDII